MPGRPRKHPPRWTSFPPADSANAAPTGHTPQVIVYDPVGTVLATLSPARSPTGLCDLVRPSSRLNTHLTPLAQPDDIILKCFRLGLRDRIPYRNTTFLAFPLSAFQGHDRLFVLMARVLLERVELNLDVFGFPERCQIAEWVLDRPGCLHLIQHLTVHLQGDPIACHSFVLPLQDFSGLGTATIVLHGLPDLDFVFYLTTVWARVRIALLRVLPSCSMPDLDLGQLAYDVLHPFSSLAIDVVQLDALPLRSCPDDPLDTMPYIPARRLVLSRCDYMEDEVRQLLPMFGSIVALVGRGQAFIGGPVTPFLPRMLRRLQLTLSKNDVDILELLKGLSRLEVLRELALTSIGGDMLISFPLTMDNLPVAMQRLHLSFQNPSLQCCHDLLRSYIRNTYWLPNLSVFELYTRSATCDVEAESAARQLTFEWLDAPGLPKTRQ